jgi:hypothetical protein
MFGLPRHRLPQLALNHSNFLCRATRQQRDKELRMAKGIGYRFLPILAWLNRVKVNPAIDAG